MKNRYTYTWISCLCLAGAAALTALSLYQVTLSAGTSGLRVGCYGMLSILLEILGFCMAWSDRKLLGRKYIFPVVMMVFHSLLFIMLAALYLLGLVGV